MARTFIKDIGEAPPPVTGVVARAYGFNATNQDIDGLLVSIGFQTIDADFDQNAITVSDHVYGTPYGGASTFTAPEDGYYHFTLQVCIQGSTASLAQATFNAYTSDGVNQSLRTTNLWAIFTSGATFSPAYHNFSDTVYMNANEELFFTVSGNSSATALNLWPNGGRYHSFVTISKVLSP